MSASGLSDVLRDMAEGRQRRPSRKPSAPPAQAQPVRGESRRSAAPAEPAARAASPAAPRAAEPETQPKQAPAAPTRSPAIRPTARRPAAAAANLQLKAAAVPVLLTVAGLLVLPMLWGVAVLLGVEVWRSDWPGATRMAVAMLACGPIAACLVGGAWWFRREVAAAAGK